MINHYIVVAHLDDIEFGLLTYTQTIKPEDKVFIYIASGGLKKHSDKINRKRLQTQLVNLSKILPKKIKIVLRIETKYYDTLFFKKKNKIRNLLEDWVNDNIKINEKNVLVTLAPDIHEDHKIISDICDVVVRPNLSNVLNSKFNMYYKFFIPSNYILGSKYNLGCSTFNFQFKNEEQLSAKEYTFKKELLNNYPKEIIKEDVFISENEIIYKIF